MKTFHHLGVPTTASRAGETYLADAKLFVTDPSRSPHSIEWLRFEKGCPMPEVLQTRAHVAFQVDDLDAALGNQKVLIPPFEPMPGVRVAFVLEDEQPVEYMQMTA
ncbi:MAG: hypothetical protein JXR77_16000 [Lentisphaeria bacterium]|nr:hypothetical protein [Lentisphaeria bacterium]